MSRNVHSFYHPGSGIVEVLVENLRSVIYFPCFY